ncbi:hypothetical protein ACNPQK_01950 [Acinetobacter guillouiae]|uniref:hypothetical protein n=1 Tax=Acinetobacter guillouiae TaxID=106649 RepID=UPI003AF8D591
MTKIMKIPFRFKGLNEYSKPLILKQLEVFGSVLGPIDVGGYTNYYLYTDLDPEYHIKEQIDGEYRHINGIKEYVSLIFKIDGYIVY